MSRLEELSNAFKARAEQLAHRLQETEVYQKLAERYQGLSPQGQRLTSFAVVAVIACALLFSPLGSYFTSQENVATFETQRDLIKDFFKTYREANKDAGLSMPPPADMLISQITSQLQSNQLLPEQIVGVTQASIEGRMIPEKFIKDVVHVSLAKLNLRQIVDIGNSLNRLSESVKMKDLSINARGDMKGYFDVTYKLYALNIPETQVMAPMPDLEEAKPSARNRKSDSGSEDEDQ